MISIITETSRRQIQAVGWIKISIKNDDLGSGVRFQLKITIQKTYSQIK